MQQSQLYKGALQADAYAGFHHLYEGGDDRRSRLLDPCKTQVPRNPRRPCVTDQERSARADRRPVFAIEKEIRGSIPEIRRSIRQGRAGPLLDSLHTWLETTLGKLSRKSDTVAAIRYALSGWHALRRYIDDGTLEIDNNAAERALRVVALGRKNYLFCSSDAAGERPPRSTHCWARPSSTVSIQRSTSSMSSRGSRTTPSIASENCFSGTSHPTRPIQSLLNKCPHKVMWTLNSQLTHTTTGTRRLQHNSGLFQLNGRTTRAA